jgi:hypothetical protein
VTTDNTRVREGDLNGPQAYGLSDDNDCEELWTKFVRHNESIFMVVNGHFHGIGQLTEANAAAKPVPQMLSNYQETAKGGYGYLRTMKFRPSMNQIEVRTFSPFLNQFLTDSGNQFTLPYN